MQSLAAVDSVQTTVPDAAASVSGLRKAYGTLEAVAGVDLEISRGEVFGLLGPNGAGKTTIVEILRDIGAGPPETFESSVSTRIGASGRFASASGSFRRRAGWTLFSPSAR